MFTEENLQELLAFEADQAAVVSLYLNADVGIHPIETIKLQVRGLLRDLPDALHEDVAQIEEYFEREHDWHQSGVALFSCQEEDFFRVYQVAVPFRNRVRVKRTPYVKPLLHLLKYYTNYGVILVDRIGARFFEFHLGELTEAGGVAGEDVRKLKHGRGSSAAGMRGGVGGARQEDEHVQRNMREAAEEATRFFTHRNIRRLFIGGTSENVAQFREVLPKRLQSTIAATLPMDMDATEKEVRERTLDILHKLNAEREQKLVERMLTSSHEGGSAVVGLIPTLRMVSDGRVDTLIVSDGFAASGFRHTASGYLAVSEEETAFGEQALEDVSDVVDEAVQRTVEQGGHVEVISENAQLESAGRIGAILRY